MSAEKTTYYIQLSSVAVVRGRVTVEAASEAEALVKAVEKAGSGDIVWKYDGLCGDGGIEVDWASK